jgi:hypothetical protein
MKALCISHYGTILVSFAVDTPHAKRLAQCLSDNE